MALPAHDRVATRGSIDRISLCLDHLAGTDELHHTRVSSVLVLRGQHGERFLITSAGDRFFGIDVCIELEGDQDCYLRVLRAVKASTDNAGTKHLAVGSFLRRAKV